MMSVSAARVRLESGIPFSVLARFTAITRHFSACCSAAAMSQLSQALTVAAGNWFSSGRLTGRAQQASSMMFAPGSGNCIT
jgi:hypothetical protein